MWKFYDIIHQYHTVMNPVDSAKLDHLLDMLNLQQNSSVVDVGCGKGEMLIRLVEKYQVKGVGIDKSPYCVKHAEALKRERVPNSDVEFLLMDGADYKGDEKHLVDLAMCIGASWIYGDYKGTIKALLKMTRQSGLVMIGEPFWRKEPPEEYLTHEGWSKSLFDTNAGNITTAEKHGLRPLYSLVSSEQDWDVYEGLHWYAADQYTISNPRDPDLNDLSARVSEGRETYLKWERQYLGWAIYLFRKTGD